MTQINAIIIDDEDRGVIALKQMIAKYCKDVEVVGEATSISEAEGLIRRLKPAVIFLDIEMPGGNGFQLLEKFSDVDFETIFVTAYQEYAVKAIKFSALDYLLKPVKADELKDAVERVKNTKLKRSAEQFELLKNTFAHGKSLSRIILSTTEGYYPVRIDDIIYCKADDSYTHFYLQNKKHYIVSKNLREYEDLFSDHNFFRVHKSFIINLDHVESVKRADGSTILMTNDHQVPLSHRKKEEFLQRIKSI